MKRLLFFIFFLAQTLNALGQNPPEEFFKGLELLANDKKQAKREFLTAVKKDSLFHGTYHFLGVVCLYDKKPDSAIFFFNKSIALNRDNFNHTQEMTLVRLIDTYLYQRDFRNSFAVAWKAYLQYPDNKSIDQGLRDVCLWSFYVKHNQLDSTYLSPEIRDEYVVNSVDEEYLVIRKIRINDEHLEVNSQSLVTKNRIHFDVINCTPSGGGPSLGIKFRLNWDLSKEFGGKVADTKKVFSDPKNPSYERIGALLVSDNKIDLKREIEKLVE